MGYPWDAKPGDKIVCTSLETDPDPDDIWENPVVGQIYTIANVIATDEGWIMFDLYEIPTTWDNEDWYPGFSSEFFKLVRNTDISIFTKMLVNIPVDA